MDTDENLINNFADTLKKHHVQKPFSLYRENQNSGCVAKHEIKDVISDVVKQLKSIQNADKVKKQPSTTSIPSLVRKSGFLPVHMLNVEQPSKQLQPHKFETQCILDTQLINIIEDAEAIIDAEKGITQEFDTTFCHKDIGDCNNEIVDNGFVNISEKTCTTVHNKVDYSSIEKNSGQSDGGVVLEDVKNGMTQEFDITFCQSKQYDNIKAKNDISIDLDTYNILLDAVNISKDSEKTDVHINDEPKTNAQRNNANICNILDTQSNFYFVNDEDDNNNCSQSKLITNSKHIIERPKSPILKILSKVESNNAEPLVFQLESFEKFESIALPIMENHDFETAKKVIISQIMNKELFIHKHAEVVLSDRDKNIQTISPHQYSQISQIDYLNTVNKYNIKEDSMLFSSDEEDNILNNAQFKQEQLPMPCNFDCETEILDKSMYVGFQTASNKTIQISTKSYSKAKSFFDNITDSDRNLSETSQSSGIENNTQKQDEDILNNSINNNNSFKIEHCQSLSVCQKIKKDTEELKIQEEGITLIEYVASRFEKTKSDTSVNFTKIIQTDSHFLEDFHKDLLHNINPQGIDFDKDQIVNRTNHDFAGFRTANNKMIKVSTQALEKTKNIFENIGHDDTLPCKNEKRTLGSISKNKPKDLECIDINNRNVQNSRDVNLGVNNNQVNNQELDLLDKRHCQFKRISNDAYQKVICENKENESQNIIRSKSFNVYKAAQVSSIVNKTDIDSELNLMLQVNKNITPNTASSTFVGFTTASNKPVKISESALTKTKKLFDDIDKKYDIYDTVSKKPASSNVVQSSTAFQKSTANQKLAETQKLFGIKKNGVIYESDSKITASNAVVQPINAFQGFITASNKPVNISESALAKTKKLFEGIDNNEEIHDCLSKMPDCDTNVQSSNEFQGYITASNKNVKISENTLAKTKEFLQHNENINTNVFNMPCITNTSFSFCQGFKTANNKAISISEKQLAKCRNIFQDIFDTKVPNFEMNSAINETPISVAKNIKVKPHIQGFKTASNKSVTISKEALHKSKKIFQNIDVEHQESITSDDFESKLIEKPLYPIANSSLNNNCDGFKTESNKSKVSKDTCTKRKRILKNIDIEDHKKSKFISVQSENHLKDKEPYPILKVSENIKFLEFITSGHNPVVVPAQALTKTKKIFENMDIDIDEEQIREDVILKQIELPTKPGNIFLEFNTASNKQVKITQNSFLKKETLRNADLYFENENSSFKIPPPKLDTEKKLVQNFGFKTASNTQINVSEEALRMSSNIFKDLESTEAKDPDEDISENVFLEDFNTEIINDFEKTVYAEDFVQNETPKSKRSGSPILSCPKAKKRKKFETPILIKKFVAPINSRNTINTDINNLYKFNEDYKRLKKYSLKDVYEMEKLNDFQNVDPYVLNSKFETLLDFEFTGNRNDIDSDRWTTEKIKSVFTDCVNKRIIPEGWMENHLKLIIWKLISYEIRFPVAMKHICTVKNVMEQLKYRYTRELYNVERPALRKILEKDEVSSKRMILCVAGLFADGVELYSVTSDTKNIELLLTDGWYTLKACADRMIDRMVCKGKIRVGTKLVICGAELVNCDQGVAPWEDTSLVRLKIFGNSTRRARWDARLGFHGNGAILSHLSAVKPEGGKVSHLRVLVTRVYPTLYIEKFPDGSTLTRSERLEQIHQMKYETERQMQMEKLYEELERFSDQESQDSEGQYIDDRAMDSGSQISRLMKKSRDRDEFRANLTSSQTDLLQQHTLKQRDKLVQAMKDKFQELVKKRGLDAPRNVVSLVKIRVADLELSGVTKAMTTIWKPTETIQDMLKEGTWIDLYNVVPTSLRYSELQISAGRSSVFQKTKIIGTDKLKTLSRTLERRCYTIKDLQNPTLHTDYNEVDTVGLIFMVEPQTNEFESKNQAFQNVYLANEDKHIICINFWGGIKKFGFQNILDTGQVVTCVNLQKRAGNTRKNIPQYRATELSYFTRTSKMDSIRKMADDLVAKFSSLDKRKFIDDCVTLKNNYHNIKCGNTDNVSPYRLNNSDYNVYKNKVFIESPLVKSTDVNLNLSGLDFESTFKQTDTQDLSPQVLHRKRKVNEKIAKLKMYGEPPPLNTIHIINKSSNTLNAFKSPLTKNYVSPVAISNALRINVANADDIHQGSKEAQESTNVPQNRVECKSNVATHGLPRNVVNKIDSSPVFSTNRTYVKRSSINPVKLNFSNALENSIVDPFAEDFDGSPPLSLDVNFLS